MRQFIKLVEDAFTQESEYEMELRVEKLIKHVFTKAGLEIAYVRRDVIYSSSDREATVYLEDAPLEKLITVYNTGIGKNFVVKSHPDFLVVEFILVDGMEQAVPA